MWLVCLCLLGGLALAQPASAFLYWSSNATGLLRATNDGSQLGFFVSTLPNSDAVAIDSTYVYWTSNDGRIGRANIDGTAPNPNFITGLPSYLPGLAVNGTSIYWSSLTAIGRANLDGTGVQSSFIAANHASGLAVDGQHIYWGENEIGKIARANLDGSGVEPSFIPAPGDPCSVAVDSSHVYWADATGNSIGRANLNGSAVEPKFLDPMARVDCGVAVSDSYVYFGVDYYPEPSSIARANLDGSGLQNVFFSLGPYGGPFVQMAVDSLQPSNAFKVIAKTLNKHKGTATIHMSLPGPGVLVLFGRGVRKVVRAIQQKIPKPGQTITTQQEIAMPVRLKPGPAARLRERGKSLAVVKLRFTPTGGSSKTKVKRLWLVDKR